MAANGNVDQCVIVYKNTGGSSVANWWEIRVKGVLFIGVPSHCSRRRLAPSIGNKCY